MLSKALSPKEEKKFKGRAFRCPDCVQWGEHKDGITIRRHECNCGLCDIEYLIECECGYQDDWATFDEEKT